MYHLAYHAAEPTPCTDPESCTVPADRHHAAFQELVELRQRLHREGLSILSFNRSDLPMLEEWERTGIPPFKF